MAEFHRTCPVCERNFLPSQQAYSGVHCSRSCAAVTSNAKHRTPLIVLCRTCGKEVRCKPNRVKNAKNNFCSPACRSEFRKTERGAMWSTWKGGRFLNKATGYMYVCHPTKRKSDGSRALILEHRLIMEQHVGRPLKRHEHVHHIDGDKMNNALSNLRLCESDKEHKQFHLKPRQQYACPWCGTTFERLPSTIHCRRPCCSKSCSNRFRHACRDDAD